MTFILWSTIEKKISTRPFSVLIRNLKDGSRDRGRKGKDNVLSFCLIKQMSHSRHIINVVSSSEIKNIMRYMFVFEVYIAIVVSS